MKKRYRMVQGKAFGVGEALLKPSVFRPMPLQPVRKAIVWQDHRFLGGKVLVSFESGRRNGEMVVSSLLVNICSPFKSERAIGMAVSPISIQGR